MRTSVRDHSWNFQANHPQQAELLEAAKWFCADIKTGQEPYWLCVIGASGTGKTHICRAICAWFKAAVCGESFILRDNKMGVKDYRFRTWAKMMAKLYAGEYEGFEEICHETLLCIDDFGAVHDPSQYGVAKFLEVLDHRRGKWSVFTSNLTMEQIAAFDTRIASRLNRDGSKVIEMNCKDFNLAG